MEKRSECAEIVAVHRGLMMSWGATVRRLCVALFRADPNRDPPSRFRLFSYFDHAVWYWIFTESLVTPETSMCALGCCQTYSGLNYLISRTYDFDDSNGGRGRLRLFHNTCASWASSNYFSLERYQDVEARGEALPAVSTRIVVVAPVNANVFLSCRCTDAWSTLLFPGVPKI